MLGGVCLKPGGAGWHIHMCVDRPTGLAEGRTGQSSGGHQALKQHPESEPELSIGCEGMWVGAGV